MNRSSRIIFFGNERLSTGYQPDGVPTLRALIENGYNVVAVVASHHEPTSRSKRKLEVQDFADKNNIPVLLPEKLTDITQQLADMQPDIGVLVAYGKIVPESIINLFPCGILNIHPSLLPKYRGSTPIEQAILDGDQEVGVSLMRLTKEMDAGPIFDQSTVLLKGNESKQDITKMLHTLGAKLLIKNLPSILKSTATPKQQDHSQATYCRQINKSDGNMNVGSKSAEQLAKEVRAYLGWPKSRLEIFDQQIIVTGANVVESLINDKLVVSCANNTYLEITELVAPSGRKMNGANFLHGYKK